ncbi:MAG: hypothetical protein IJW96_04995 [Clostridia bacterium]|nr:hypothetical protein [Clostridia bacterium]
MMQTKNLITQMLEGNERGGDTARNALPSSRYQLFKDIFTGHFGVLVKVNLLMLLFFLPLLLVVFSSYISAMSNGILYPFGSNLGIGYPAVPDLQGTAELITLQTGATMSIWILVTSLVASVGLAGGMYAIRNIIWTEGVFVIKDFWRGVKLNYKNALQAALFFCVVFTLSLCAINVSNFNIAMGVEKGELIFLRISQVLSYIMIVVSALMSFWMIALGVNYKMKFGALLKNSFLIGAGTLPQTVLFAIVSLIPFALFFLAQFSEIFFSIGLGCLIFFSFSFALLVWLDYAQWVFDRYINPKTTGKRTEGDKTVYNKEGTPQLTGDDSESVLAYQRSIIAMGRSHLMSHPMAPLADGVNVYHLPKNYTRSHLKTLSENRAMLQEGVDAYVEAHKNDARYTEYETQFVARELALKEQESDKKKKKKSKKNG